MAANPHWYVCILAGGTGERFWPMSRTRKPKHLLKLVTDRTLLEETLRRVSGVVPRSHLFVLTNKAQLRRVRAALPGLRRHQIVAEPARRDTAPAAALATGLVHARDPKAVVALLPADAYIGARDTFAAQLKAAFSWAAGRESLLTFAVKPTHPSTGFGYLELGRRLPGAGGEFRRVRRFVEKPDAATARRYLTSGRFAWNAGMFLWRTEVFRRVAQAHAPELAAFIGDFPAGNPGRYLARRFPSLPRISVDYAIMEKADLVATLLARFDWDDVGTWTALRPHLSEDKSGNAARGPFAAVAAEGNIAVSNGRMIALCGVRGLVVVETPDAVLVCGADSVQDIKRLQPLLPASLR